MRLRDPRLWLALLASMSVLAIAIADLGRTAPGSLATVHSRLAELDGGARCAACHGGWFSDLPHACAECHGDIAEQVAARTGLHGSLGGDAARNCGVCHSEHHGGDFALVNRASWAMAGVPDTAAFDHARIGWPLDGAHLQLPCARCHVHADDRPLADGDRRYLGLDSGCASCHDDPHGGAMAVRCDQCHGQVSFAVPASTGHERFLALRGGHAEVDCSRCHEPGSPRDVMTLGATRGRAPRGCTDCHESPHRDAVLAAVPASPAGETRGQGSASACATCHEPDHDDFAAARATMTPERHAAAGFPLAAPHDEVECASCHAASGTFAARHPGRGADACATCHADPHGGQFADSKLAGHGCLSCHAREHFAPHAFTPAMHARTALPLDGRHLQAQCESCHEKPAPDAPRAFHGMKARCDDCHADAHGDAFRDHQTELAATPGGTCATCHDAHGFAGGATQFDHARFTALPLDGAHAQAACETCHPRTATPDAAGRTFGRVLDQHGAFRGCITCHDDPHGGRFDRAGLPAEDGGRRDCARCHGTASFRALPQPFEHGLWTGFPLHGAHASVRCGDCHPARVPTAAGPVVAKARGTDCADCHAEPHAGQFAIGTETDCRRCHRAAATFRDLTFRHDLDARFALGSAHRAVACGRCHHAEQIAGAEVVRYRPVPRECTDCHDQLQDPLRRQTRDGGQQGGRR